MLTALYSGVSGLKAQQQKLNVLGNNIANVNTVGFKGEVVSFSDLLSQTLSGATGPSTTTSRGGTNAMQVGLGVGVASITTNMSTGSTQSTGNYTDVSIGGAGFFIVQGGTSGEYQFTRAGNFSIDSSGNLTVDGYKVCGWQQYSVDSEGNYVYNTQKTVEPINIYSDSYNGNKKIMAPKVTTAASLTGNLDPSKDANGTALDTITTPLPDTPSATATMKVYDAQGNGYDVQVKLYKCYTDSATNTTSYYWEAVSSDTASLAVSGASGYIEFDSTGKIITTDPAFNTNPTITLTPQGTYAGAASFNVSLDFSDLSYYTSATDSGISVGEIDGYAAGELQDIAIGSDGIIYGVYSNDQLQPLGMIAMAVFKNPSGLEKIGDNLYITTANSGDFTGGVAPGTGGSASLSPGTLEMSNVDLSEQFSEMMITQRAYQANSKVITTSDNILQTLINMVQ